MRKTITATFVILSLVSCGLSANKEKAEGVTKQFYDAIKQKKFSDAAGLVHERGLAESPKKKWVGLFKKVRKSAGKLKSYTVDSWGFNTSTSKGTTITFQITAHYSKKSSGEKLVLLSLPGEEDMKILGYFINTKKKKKKESNVDKNLKNI